MSEEEKEAIWYCAEILGDNKNDIEHWKIVENLIDKLQKENREYEYTIAGMVQTREDNFIPKYKIKELKEKIHQELDNNGITRAHQITIDKYFDELWEENE